MTERKTIPIELPLLARVEGEGALELEVEQGEIRRLALHIFEPPRYFEKFLEGRHYDEIPDIVARICGICPVAYQVTAANALESLYAAEPSPELWRLRRLMYCGEWIQSHALHIHLLAAPDFLGHDSVISLAGEHPELVRRGLMLQSLGNELIGLVGARSVHPVGLAIGGFHGSPDPVAARALHGRIHAALPEARALVDWAAALPLPEIEQDFISVALDEGSHYPMTGGQLRSDHGLDCPPEAWETHFVEHQVPQSTALHCLLDGAPYLVGPLARMNLARDQLHPEAAAALADTAIDWPSRNPFHSLLARAVELYQALLEANELLGSWQLPDPMRRPLAVRAGRCFGVSEAPRGTLWHRYDMGSDGHVLAARIVPPTSQNQARMEADLAASLTAHGLHRAEHELRAFGEQVIRNYDPCISCATHFLDLRMTRR